MKIKHKNIKKNIIAVDGVSSSGKSTLSKIISTKLNYQYLDTGAIYRSVTLLAIRENIFNSDLWNIKNFINIVKKIKIKFINNKTNIFFQGENLRHKIESENVTIKTPIISRIPEIRKILISMQRNMAKIVYAKGMVVDGRDIGNCVFPQSKLKIFLNSSLETRAKRRYNTIKKKKINISYQKVKSSLYNRDIIDITRKISPLKKSYDHIEIDNTFLSIKTQLNFILKLLKNK